MLIFEAVLVCNRFLMRIGFIVPFYIENFNISDFYMGNTVLYIEFLDGSKFEYFGVPKNTYIKMVNAESPSRFARRHVYTSFLCRSFGLIPMTFVK